MIGRILELKEIVLTISVCSLSIFFKRFIVLKDLNHTNSLTVGWTKQYCAFLYFTPRLYTGRSQFSLRVFAMKLLAFNLMAQGLNESGNKVCLCKRNYQNYC